MMDRYCSPTPVTDWSYEWDVVDRLTKVSKDDRTVGDDDHVVESRTVELVNFVPPYAAQPFWFLFGTPPTLC